jgi:hypothetical protein
VARGVAVLQALDEFGERDFQRVGDPLGGREGRRVPASLDLAEVLGVHARDAVGDLLKRLVALLASLAHPDAEPPRNRISGRAARHRRIDAGGT